MQGLSSNEMYHATLKRDSRYEGLFFLGVKTTGIFCRPTCRARKPKPENVEYFASAKEALLNGYRPCKVCRPMEPAGTPPDWLAAVMNEVNTSEAPRMRDEDLRRLGVDPHRVRRWFKSTHGMTFQGYLRSLRLGRAFSNLAKGAKVIDVAFDSGYESLSAFGESFKKATKRSPRASLGEELIYLTKLSTPLGPMLAGAVRDGICLLEFTDRRMLETELEDLQKRLRTTTIVARSPYVDELERQLGEYFSGHRHAFDLPLVTPGSTFQQRVWNVLRQIPYGETRSYFQQAKAIDNPKAVRAVARANGMNRIAIVIPCHRVIGADGKLVGYAGGLWRKQRLLDLEQGKPF